MNYMLKVDYKDLAIPKPDGRLFFSPSRLDVSPKLSTFATIPPRYLPNTAINSIVRYNDILDKIISLADNFFTNCPLTNIEVISFATSSYNEMLKNEGLFFFYYQLLKEISENKPIIDTVFLKRQDITIKRSNYACSLFNRIFENSNFIKGYDDCILPLKIFTQDEFQKQIIYSKVNYGKLCPAVPAGNQGMFLYSEVSQESYVQAFNSQSIITITYKLISNTLLFRQLSRYIVLECQLLSEILYNLVSPPNNFDLNTKIEKLNPKQFYDLTTSLKNIMCLHHALYAGVKLFDIPYDPLTDISAIIRTINFDGLDTESNISTEALSHIPASALPSFLREYLMKNNNLAIYKGVDPVTYLFTREDGTMSLEPKPEITLGLVWVFVCVFWVRALQTLSIADDKIKRFGTYDISKITLTITGTSNKMVVNGIPGIWESILKYSNSQNNFAYSYQASELTKLDASKQEDRLKATNVYPDIFETSIQINSNVYTYYNPLILTILKTGQKTIFDFNLNDFLFSDHEQIYSDYVTTLKEYMSQSKLDMLNKLKEMSHFIQVPQIITYMSTYSISSTTLATIIKNNVTRTQVLNGTLLHIYISLYLLATQTGIFIRNNVNEERFINAFMVLNNTELYTQVSYNFKPIYNNDDYDNVNIILDVCNVKLCDFTILDVKPKIHVPTDVNNNLDELDDTDRDIDDDDFDAIFDRAMTGLIYGFDTLINISDSEKQYGLQLTNLIQNIGINLLRNAKWNNLTSFFSEKK